MSKTPGFESRDAYNRGVTGEGFETKDHSSPTAPPGDCDAIPCGQGSRLQHNLRIGVITNAVQGQRVTCEQMGDERWEKRKIEFRKGRECLSEGIGGGEGALGAAAKLVDRPWSPC